MHRRSHGADHDFGPEFDTIFDTAGDDGSVHTVHDAAAFGDADVTEPEHVTKRQPEQQHYGPADSKPVNFDY